MLLPGAFCLSLSYIHKENQSFLEINPSSTAVWVLQNDDEPPKAWRDRTPVPEDGYNLQALWICKENPAGSHPWSGSFRVC